jgi:TolB protein
MWRSPTLPEHQSMAIRWSEKAARRIHVKRRRRVAGVGTTLLVLTVVAVVGSIPQRSAAARTSEAIAVALARGTGNQGSGGIVLINPSGRRIATLTTPRGGGEDSEPAWSRDGKRLAFTRTTDGRYSFQIYVINADGSGLRRVTKARRLVFDTSPAWSLDSRWIAYRSNGELRIVHPDGSGDRQLPTPHPTEVTFPGWAPGGRIAYSYWDTWPGDAPASCKRAGMGCGYVLSSRLDGAARRLVVRGRDAHWWRDGRIVYTGPDGGVYTAAAASGAGRFLGRGYLADWTRDGTGIVYVRQGDMPSHDSVWIMNRDGHNAHRILIGASNPAWRP